MRTCHCGTWRLKMYHVEEHELPQACVRKQMDEEPSPSYVCEHCNLFLVEDYQRVPSGRLLVDSHAALRLGRRRVWFRRPIPTSSYDWQTDSTQVSYTLRTNNGDKRCFLCCTQASRIHVSGVNRQVMWKGACLCWSTRSEWMISRQDSRSEHNDEAQFNTQFVFEVSPFTPSSQVSQPMVPFDPSCLT